MSCGKTNSRADRRCRRRRRLRKTGEAIRRRLGPILSAMGAVIGFVAAGPAGALAGAAAGRALGGLAAAGAPPEQAGDRTGQALDYLLEQVPLPGLPGPQMEGEEAIIGRGGSSAPLGPLDMSAVLKVFRP